MQNGEIITFLLDNNRQETDVYVKATNGILTILGTLPMQGAWPCSGSDLLRLSLHLLLYISLTVYAVNRLIGPHTSTSQRSSSVGLCSTLAQ